jgi:hypothetical protein
VEPIFSRYAHTYVDPTLDFKAGVPFSSTSDGLDFGVELEITRRF